LQREGDRSEITGVTWKISLKAQWRPELYRKKAGFLGPATAKASSPGETVRMKSSIQLCAILTAVLLVLCTLSAQDAAPTAVAGTQAPAYQSKFAGDPARSDSEAAALAYMRVVLRAQRRFNKQYDHFATSLAELVHSGSFTKRMVNPDRGDYTATFKGKKDSFVLTMTPKNLDAQHRSFYAEDDGKIHADETKAADANSPLVK
jgi:hypothetical protein